MKNTLLMNLRLSSLLRFLLGAAAILGAMVYISLQTLILLVRDLRVQSAFYHIQLLLAALGADEFPPLVPIAAVLPFAGAYVDSLKSHFAMLTVFRTERRRYLIGLYLCCFLLGGGVILAGVFTAWFLSALLLLPLEAMPKTGELSSTPELAARCALLFLNGGLWASIGMTMSSLMESKYIAYASPFILYYLLVILAERYLPDARLLDPRMWMDPSPWPYGWIGAALWVLELSCAGALLFLYEGERRLLRL